MSLDYIRRTYNVPAKRGGRVIYHGDGRDLGATILSGTHLIKVRFDSGQVANLHPTWKVTYPDAVSIHKQQEATDG